MLPLRAPTESASRGINPTWHACPRHSVCLDRDRKKHLRSAVDSLLTSNLFMVGRRRMRRAASRHILQRLVIKTRGNPCNQMKWRKWKLTCGRARMRGARIHCIQPPTVIHGYFVHVVTVILSLVTIVPWVHFFFKQWRGWQTCLLHVPLLRRTQRAGQCN